MKKSKFVLSLNKDRRPLYLVDNQWKYVNMRRITEQKPMPYWDYGVGELLTISQVMLAIEAYLGGRGRSTRFEFYWGEQIVTP